MESYIEAVRRSLHSGRTWLSPAQASRPKAMFRRFLAPTVCGGIILQRLATAEGFTSNPCLVWEWHDWLRGVPRTAEPSPGRLAVAQMQRRSTAG